MHAIATSLMGHMYLIIVLAWLKYFLSEVKITSSKPPLWSCIAVAGGLGGESWTVSTFRPCMFIILFESVSERSLGLLIIPGLFCVLGFIRVFVVLLTRKIEMY